MVSAHYLLPILELKSSLGRPLGDYGMRTIVQYTGVVRKRTSKPTYRNIKTQRPHKIRYQISDLLKNLFQMIHGIFPGSYHCSVILRWYTGLSVFACQTQAGVQCSLFLDTSLKRNINEGCPQ